MLVNKKTTTSPVHKLINVILLLIGFSFVSIFLRISAQQDEGVPSGDKVWSIQQTVELQANSAGSLIRVARPYNTSFSSLYEQKYFHPDLRLRLAKSDKQSREIVFAATRKGNIKFEMSYAIRINSIKRKISSAPLSSDLDRAKWLLSSDGIPVDSAIAGSVIDSLSAEKPEPDVLIERIFNYVSESIRIKPTGHHDAGEVLKQQKGSSLGVTRTLITLLRAAHFPARMVTGLNLSLENNKQPIHWVEVFYDSKWLPIDVIGLHFNELPSSFIPLKKGSEQIVETTDAVVNSIAWQFAEVPSYRGVLASSDQPSPLDILDFTRLEPNARMVLSVLLLLPLGALATELLRQVGGVRTYGTFTPSLLALAAVFVDWMSAAITFSLVTLLGVVGRALLPDIGMSRVARLSIVFTLVAFLMALVVSMLSYYHPSLDTGIVLLPIVILTTLVDRVYTVTDEKGPRVALIRLGWTVLAAVLSVFVLMQEALGEWIVMYPEIHAITIAAIIILGRYNGPVIINQPGLQWLKEPVGKKTKKKGTEDGI